MKPYTIQLEYKATPVPDYEHRHKAVLRALARLLLRVESEREKLEAEALPVMVAELEPELEKSR